MTLVGFLAGYRGCGHINIRPESHPPAARVASAVRADRGSLEGSTVGARVGGWWLASGDLSLVSTLDRRLRDDERGLRGERGSSRRLRGRKAEGLEGDPYNLIGSIPAKGNRLPDWFAHRPAVEVRRGGVAFDAAALCWLRGRAPTSCGARLPSPTWDEVPENWSGGTTIEFGAPSSGRDAALNVARPARRHRRLHSRRQQSGHRTELRTVARPTGVAPPRRWLPVGQEGHEGGDGDGEGEHAVLVAGAEEAKPRKVEITHAGEMPQAVTAGSVAE
jgi:hypothetical protein